MDNKKKITILLIAILVVIMLGMVGTYAWYVWSTSDEDTTKIVTKVGAATVTYDAGPNMIGQALRPVDSKELGLKKDITIKTDRNSVDAITFNLYLDVNSLGDELKHESFKYEIYKDDTLKNSGNFSQDSLNTNLVTCNVNSTSHIVLLTDEIISTGLSTYTLYIWIDGANYDNPSTMQNQIFNFTLHADGQNAISDDLSGGTEDGGYVGPTLIDHITTLYMNNKDEELVPNNGIQYRYASIYDKDDDENTSGGLMNDRQGLMTVGEDNGNIRYYGLNPNNYIYFNCEDYDNQSDTTCEKWRIIGIVDGKVKLIRTSNIGKYAWDNKTTGIGSAITDYGSNEWSDSRLMMLLNPGYDKNVYDTNYNLLNEHNRSYYWNSTGTSTNPVKCYYYRGTTETTDCYFNNTGLKNDTTRALIADTTWYLKGFDNKSTSSGLFSNQTYQYERNTGTVFNGNSKVWTGRIALIYPSDYGYAADLKICNGNMYDYETTSCATTNWIKPIIIRGYGNHVGCFLTPNIYNSEVLIGLSTDGAMQRTDTVSSPYDIIPVLHLNSGVAIGLGDGSQSNPYQLLTDSFLN